MTKSQSHCFIIVLTSLHINKCWFSWPKIIQKFKRPSNFRASVDREIFFFELILEISFFRWYDTCGSYHANFGTAKAFWGGSPNNEMPSEKKWYRDRWTLFTAPREGIATLLYCVFDLFCFGALYTHVLSMGSGSAREPNYSMWDSNSLLKYFINF